MHILYVNNYIYSWVTLFKFHTLFKKKNFSWFLFGADAAKHYFGRLASNARPTAYAPGFEPESLCVPKSSSHRRHSLHIAWTGDSWLSLKQNLRDATTGSLGYFEKPFTAVVHCQQATCQRPLVRWKCNATSSTSWMRISIYPYANSWFRRTLCICYMPVVSGPFLERIKWQSFDELWITELRPCTLADIMLHWIKPALSADFRQYIDLCMCRPFLKMYIAVLIILNLLQESVLPLILEDFGKNSAFPAPNTVM